MKKTIRNIFRLGDIQAILIILSSFLLNWYAASRFEPSSLLAIAVYLYALYGFIVLIVKMKEWLTRLNRAIRKRHPKYDQFCTLRAESLNSRGRGAKVIYITLRVLTILSAVAMLIQGEYGNFVLCIFTLLLFTLPDLIQQRFSIHLPTTLETIIYCFIFAAEILGEINNFYGIIHGWDTMLHTMNGFLCAAIGFALVDMLNRNSKNIHLSPFYLALTAFCFSMTVGVVWEFIEFFGDQFFAVDMQKDTIVPVVKSILINPTGENVPLILRDIQQTVIHYGSGENLIVPGGYLDIGIVDTMKDLFVNFIGAVVFSAFGYFYVKDRDQDKHSFAKRFIPVVESTVPSKQ